MSTGAASTLLAMSDAQPAGWYHDGVAQRWWDGEAWGPYAPAPPPGPGMGPGVAPPPPGGPSADEADKTVAVLAHAGGLFGGFLLPLIIYLMNKDKGERSYARHHSLEALNFQLAVMIVTFVPMILFFAVFVAVAVAASSSSSAAPGVGFGLLFGLFWIVMMVVGVGSLVLSIVGMVKASQLERWRYPVSIRLVGRSRAG